MVQYICDRCGKEYDHKSSYVKHTKRKIPCQEVIKDNTKNDFQIFAENGKNLQKSGKDTDIKEADDKFKCACHHCDKNFYSKYTLERHLNICKLKKQHENEEKNKFQILMEQIIESKKQINELKLINENQKNDFSKQINELKEICKNNKGQQARIINNNNTTNNITNNQQINININSFAETDMSFLSNDDIKLLLRKGEECVESLVEIVHFDKNRPENHNIYISNIKEPYILLYDGKEWKRLDKDNTIEELYEDKSGFLSDKCNELRQNEIIDEITNRKFEGFQNNMDGFFDECKMRNRIIANLGTHLHNKRDIPMKTRNLVKQNIPNKLEQ